MAKSMRVFNRYLLALAMALPAAAHAAPPENTVVVGLSADASTFDPAQISSRDNSNIAKHIFATLFRSISRGRSSHTSSTRRP
jgi:peptide/nickel transport system substrate-binding protein